MTSYIKYFGVLHVLITLQSIQLLQKLSNQIQTSNFFVKAHQEFQEDEEEQVQIFQDDEFQISDNDEQILEYIQSKDSTLNEDGQYKTQSGINIPAQDNSQKSIQEKLIGFFQHEPIYYYIHYKLELGFLVGIILIMIQFYVGQNKNKSLAMVWRHSCVRPLIEQFEHLGCANEKSYALMQTSYSNFEFLASGRKNMLYAEFKLFFIRRQCFLTNYIFDTITGQKDRVQIDIPIDIGDRVLPLEVYICRIKDIKEKLKEFKHLNEYVKNSNTKHYKLSEKQLENKNNLMIMTEHDEVANNLISEEIGEALLRLGKTGLLNEIHITDLNFYNNYPLFLRATIEIPSDENDKKGYDNVANLIILILYLVDKVSEIRHSPTVLSKCQKSRKKLKQEVEQKKKEDNEEKLLEQKREQDRLEREKLKRMTPEQQQKYEEKQRKKEQQRQKSKIMKVAKI